MATGLTPDLQLPYPEPGTGEPANGPAQMKALALRLEEALPEAVEGHVESRVPSAVDEYFAANPSVVDQAAAAAAAGVGTLTAAKATALDTNLVVNPQGKSGPIVNPNAAVYTQAEISAGLPAGFSYGVRSTRNAGAGSVIGDIYFGTTGAHAQAIAVTPGDKISIGVYGYVDDPAAGLVARVRAKFYDAAGAFLSNVDPSGTGLGNGNSVIARATWERRKLENVTVPASAAYVIVDFIANVHVEAFPSATPTVGSIVRATGAQVAKAATLPAYGDGNSNLWAWNGTPHASTSRRVFRTTTEEASVSTLVAQAPAIISEVGAAAAVQASLYSGTATGKNLFNPADPDVLIDKFPGGDPVNVYTTIAGYATTGWIPVTPGQQIAVNQHRVIFFTDAAHVQIGATVNTGNNATQAVYAVPAGAAFVRIGYRYDTYPLLQVEVGAAQTAYEPYQAPYFTLTSKMTEAVKKTASVAPTGPVKVTVAGNVVAVTTKVNGKDLVVTLGKNTSKQGALNLDGTTYDGVAVATINDEVTPIRTQLGTVGANHGYVSGIYLAPNPDGKTVADVGSTWQDTAGREYVLAAVVAGATPLVFMGSYTGGGAAPVAAIADLPTTDLTHKAGATHQGSVPVGGIVAGNAGSGLTQLTPSTARQSVTLFLDGVQITGDGTYYGTGQFEVRETYEVLDYKSIYDTLKANIGTALSALTAGIEGAVLVQNVFRYLPGGRCRIGTSYDELKPTTLGICGTVQAMPLSMAGYTTTRYVPGMGVVGGFDWSAGVDYTAYASTVDLPAASERVAGRISAFHLDTLTSGGNAYLGFAMGYLPFGSRADSASRSGRRLTNAAGALWNMRNTKKCYPAWTTGEAAGWGHFQVDAFRAYLNPTQVAAVTARKTDALTSFAALDTVDALT